MRAILFILILIAAMAQQIEKNYADLSGFVRGQLPGSAHDGNEF